RVVGFPAPAGPLTPRVGPPPPSGVRSSTAVSSPNRFVACTTETAGGWTVAGRVVAASMGLGVSWATTRWVEGPPRQSPRDRVGGAQHRAVHVSAEAVPLS